MFLFTMTGLCLHLNDPGSVGMEDVFGAIIRSQMILEYSMPCVLSGSLISLFNCPPLLHTRFPAHRSTPIPEMLPCLRRVGLLRPALSLRAGSGLATTGSSNHQAPGAASQSRLASEPPLSTLVQRCNLGTHPLKEPVEPLNSPRGAKEFIYSLHPSERTCLLRELHKFESIAIAQGR